MENVNPGHYQTESKNSLSAITQRDIKEGCSV